MTGAFGEDADAAAPCQQLGTCLKGLDVVLAGVSDVAGTEDGKNAGMTQQEGAPGRLEETAVGQIVHGTTRHPSQDQGIHDGMWVVRRQNHGAPGGHFLR